MLDAKTFDFEYQVSVNDIPLALAVSRNGRELYLAAYSGNVLVVDLARRAVVHEIPIGSVPNDIVLDAGKDRLYLTTEYGLTAIDARSFAVIATVGGIGIPTNLALDRSVTHASPPPRPGFGASIRARFEPGNSTLLVRLPSRASRPRFRAMSHEAVSR